MRKGGGEMLGSSIEKLLRAQSIDLADTRPGDHKTTCPRCSHKAKSKHNQVRKVLSVKIDDKGVCWHCNRCGWSGPTKGNGQGEERFIATYNYVDRTALCCGRNSATHLEWNRNSYSADLTATAAGSGGMCERASHQSSTGFLRCAPR